MTITKTQNVLQANERECGGGSKASLLVATGKTKQRFTADQKGTKEGNDRRTGAGRSGAGKDFGQVSILVSTIQLHISFRPIMWVPHLIVEPAQSILRQKVELERLGQVMRSKDHYGNDQLSGQQVSASLRAVGLTVERSAFASWLRSADTIGKGIYSIPGLLEVMSQAVKRAKGEEGRPARDKRIPEVHERRDKALVAAPLTNANTKEEDLSWQQLLDLNSSLPRVRGRGEDGGLRLRNLARLRSAMEQSYKQQHGEQTR